MFFPEALQDRTATRRWSRSAVRISCCFPQGDSPSLRWTNKTGLLRVMLPRSCLSERVGFEAFFLGLV